MIRNYIAHIAKKISFFFEKEIKIKVVPFTDKKKYGTKYGGWIIPSKLLNETSICYMVGAGEDISSDIEIAKHFNCAVFIFDPIARSKKHFEEFSNSIINNSRMYISNNYYYDIEPEKLTNISFSELGLWTEKNTLKFYSPENENHVSHSLVNLQSTSNYVLVPVQRLSGIMDKNRHVKLDLLKLDIEGAEFEVLNTIIQDKIKANILCIEFHRTKYGDIHKIQTCINKLIEFGYSVIAKENLDFTFLRNEIVTC